MGLRRSGGDLPEVDARRAEALNANPENQDEAARNHLDAKARPVDPAEAAEQDRRHLLASGPDAALAEEAGSNPDVAADLTDQALGRPPLDGDQDDDEPARHDR